MSSSPADETREQQRATWNKFSPGWKKWDGFNMKFLRPMGDAIVEALELKETDHVLDVAAGTGEPGLTIAKIVAKGKVISTDLAEGMLKTAEGYALEQGLNNFEVRIADACALPFEDSVFDAVSCRMGFMFFPDMVTAAKEIHRVLKPGGKFAASVWNLPAKNFWVTAIMGTIGRNLDLPPPPPGAPGMFRCAQPGVMTRVLEEAGFKHVREQEISGKTVYESADHYWTNMLDLAAPVVSAMSRADDSLRAKIKAELYELLRTKVGNGELSLDFSAIVLSARK